MNFSESNKNKYYRTCPTCGANLDPGEICEDCKEKENDDNKKIENKPVKESVRSIFSESNKKDDFDYQYGIPEQKKYPLYDKEHVISAIRLFGHVEPRFEEKLARAIIAKMRKYNIPFDIVGKDNNLYKYIPEKYLKEESGYYLTELNESKFNINKYETAEEVGRALAEYNERRAEMLKNENDYPSMAIESIDNIIKKLNEKMKEFDCKCEKKSLREEQKQNTEILNNIRKDIQDELTAVKGYDTHADEAEKEGYKDIADVLRDIRDEEKVHIGELQALLNKYDKTFSKSIKDGQKEVMEELTESVLDPVQKTRCLEIFDSTEKMLPEVKNFIVETFKKWKDELDNVSFTIDGIYLIGSSASFQYTETSDVDITIVSHDFNEEENWEVIRILPNGNNLPNTEKPVNYFIRNELVERLAENIYDIQNDEWIKKTSPEDISIPHSYILELAKFFMNAIDLTVSEFERDKTAYLEYKALDPEKVEITEEEKTDVMNKKMEELKADLDSIRIGNHLIRGFVHDAYDSEEKYFRVNIEIPNLTLAPQKSVNNLVYKCLEKYGYRDKIDNFIKDAKEFIENEKTEKE